MGLFTDFASFALIPRWVKKQEAGFRAWLNDLLTGSSMDSDSKEAAQSFHHSILKARRTAQRRRAALKVYHNEHVNPVIRKLKAVRLPPALFYWLNAVITSHTDVLVVVFAAALCCVKFPGGW